MRFEAHLECLPGSTQVHQHHGLDAGEEKEASPGRTQATVVRQSLKVQLKVASSQLWMVEKWPNKTAGLPQAHVTAIVLEH